jgi:hypothetical protein
LFLPKVIPKWLVGMMSAKNMDTSTNTHMMAVKTLRAVIPTMMMMTKNKTNSTQPISFQPHLFALARLNQTERDMFRIQKRNSGQDRKKERRGDELQLLSIVSTKQRRR